MTEQPKRNVTQDDLSICPHCDFNKFYCFDGNRLFCVSCRKEVRNNKNFQEGKIVGLITD